MRTLNITARRPQDVARDVERGLRRGFRSFVLRGVSGGGMLDLERLGAARYAAGFAAQVKLDGVGSSEASEEPSVSEDRDVAAPLAEARAR
jgi:L-alanine-DL-glutamate epimerase-like enolase superfamily enzyme